MAPTVVAVDGQTVSVGRLGVGQEIGYRWDLEGMRLTPLFARDLHWDFKQAESFILVDDKEALDALRAGGEFGIRAQSDGMIAGNLAVTYDGLFSDDVAAFGVKGALSIPFQ